MLRVLFIRYLIDRGVNIGYMGLNDDVNTHKRYSLILFKIKMIFLKLIKYLKERFNGNLFEVDEQKEKSEITDEALSVLYSFFDG